MYVAVFPFGLSVFLLHIRVAHFRVLTDRGLLLCFALALVEHRERIRERYVREVRYDFFFDYPVEVLLQHIAAGKDKRVRIVEAKQDDRSRVVASTRFRAVEDAEDVADVFDYARERYVLRRLDDARFDRLFRRSAVFAFAFFFVFFAYFFFALRHRRELVI